MKISDIPFGTTQWETVEVTEHAGLSGKAFWRTQTFADIRVRMCLTTVAKKGISC